MNKKIMLLALAAVSATMFALPSAASANPALHITSAPTAFTATSAKAGFLTRADNNNVECKTTSSSGGEFTTTTTFKLTLTFHTCRSTALGVSCQSGATSGTITTTELIGHLTTVTTPAETGTAHGLPGVLLTSNNGHFATFKCFGIEAKVTGKGILGELTSPTCGASSTTAGLKFTSASAGNQKHITWTGETYDLISHIGGATQTSSIDAEATVTFTGGAQTLTCT